MSDVKVQNVSKSFNGVTAVDRVSMEIKAGEFFSLLGPSGCGKTTLLRMIAGLEFPDSGAILLSGKDLTSVPANRRPVNMVFQSYALFPHLTVFENIAFGLRLAKVQESQIQERVSQALQLVRLPDLWARYPKQLSGGQQQRIAFARAVVNRPSVLLLDEPLSALDPKIRVEMQAELARFKKELQMTFIMVSHDQSEAFGLSDRLAVMSAGKVEQIGTPEEIYGSPATSFVADFIGNTNVFQARIISNDRHSCTVELDDKVTLRARLDHLTTAPGPGESLHLWIRSSAIKIRQEPFVEQQDFSRRSSQNIENNQEQCTTEFNELKATVIHRSFQGENCDYRLQLTPKLQLNATVQQNESSPIKLAVGESCRAIIAANDVRLVRSSSTAN